MHAKLTGRWRGLAAVPMDNGTRTQYPQTTATPGPSKFRMQFPHDTNRCTLKNRRISTIRLQYLKYAQGNCMRNYRDAGRTQHHATTRPRRCGGCGKARPRCRWAAGPGRASRRRAEPKARGRAATHERIKQPGPRDWPRSARNTHGATSNNKQEGRRPRAHQAAWPNKVQQGKATKSSPSGPCAPGGASRPGRNGCGPRCAAPRLQCQ